MSRLAFIREQAKKTPVQANVIVGRNFQHGSNVSIGGDGFGFEKNEQGEYEFMQHFGDVYIGDDVKIGSNTCIDRGAVEHTQIGNGTKIDNLVHIAHGVKIGDNCLIVAGSVICGSTEIGGGTYIGANVTIREHLKIGQNVFIGMGSVVTKDIPSNEMWYGNPAKFIKKI
jgi:UDP-3-O-[3-hydroxymyristoyl] glucosamine N-acyltransferase